MKKILALLLFSTSGMAQSNAWPNSDFNLWKGDSTFKGYGDPYLYTTRSLDSGITNFFMLEGPGNSNPGNSVSGANNSLSDTLANFIARQYKYVLFDQESFAERDANHNVIHMMGNIYHQEAQKLMSKNSGIIVFPYFCLTVGNVKYPWLSQSLLDTYKTNVLFNHINDQYLMDITNPDWKNIMADSIVAIVSRYNYRGVFLDNMSKYPLIAGTDYSNAPDYMKNDTWLNNLKNFADILRAKLIDEGLKGIIIICNCIGLDGTTTVYPSVNALWGPDGGIELATYPAVNGGLTERFDVTRFADDYQLTRNLMIMRNILSAGKKFFAATTFHRGGYGAFRDFDLTCPPDSVADSFWNNWGNPPGNGGNILGMPYWKANFYRLNMSYLARFLLGLPTGVDPNNYGFSFQPGYSLNQMIPYYSIWDRRFGAATGDTFTYSINITARDFENCRVFVNHNTQYSYSVTFQGYSLHGDPALYCYGPYFTFPDQLTLNKDEGVIVFKNPAGHREERQPSSHASIAPSQYSVEQNYPNPFNPSTSISYGIPDDGFVRIRVFDDLGREIESIVNEFKKAGYYSIPFDGHQLSGGIYFYDLSINGFHQTKKMILIK